MMKAKMPTLFIHSLSKRDVLAAVIQANTTHRLPTLARSAGAHSLSTPDKSGYRTLRIGPISLLRFAQAHWSVLWQPGKRSARALSARTKRHSTETRRAATKSTSGYENAG